MCISTCRVTHITAKATFNIYFKTSIFLSHSFAELNKTFLMKGSLVCACTQRQHNLKAIAISCGVAKKIRMGDEEKKDVEMQLLQRDSAVSCQKHHTSRASWMNFHFKPSDSNDKPEEWKKLQTLIKNDSTDEVKNLCCNSYNALLFREGTYSGHNGIFQSYTITLGHYIPQVFCCIKTALCTIGKK